MSCTNCSNEAKQRCKDCQKPFCNNSISASGIFVGNIEQMTLENQEMHALPFQERCTGRLQIGLSSVMDRIPMETHPFVTQFIRIEGGLGVLKMDKKSIALSKGVAIVIPAGMAHEIVNYGREGEPLK